MVDVDHPVGPGIDEPRRQHAHVAREHDDVGRGLGEHRGDRALLLVAVVADGHMTELDVETAHERAVCLVVRRDEHDLARQLAERVAHQEIGEAVALARREQRHAWPRCQIVQRPLHRELLREWLEPAPERLERRVDVELDPLEEEVGGRIGVLVGLHDVAAEVGHVGADRRDDARPIGALQEKGGPHLRCSEQLEIGIDVAAQAREVDLHARDALALARRPEPGA